jgi:hypothetical protein
MITDYRSLIVDYRSGCSHPNWKVGSRNFALMLLLDSITLFFHNRSAVDKSEAGLIDNWAAEVRRSGQPPKRTPTRSLGGDSLASPTTSSTAISTKFKPRYPSGLSTSTGTTAVTEDIGDADTMLVSGARSAKTTTTVSFRLYPLDRIITKCFLGWHQDRRLDDDLINAPQ